MRFSRLVESLDGQLELPLQGDPDIKSIHFRSDAVSPGGAFVAVKGFRADGHDYIRGAVAAGAVAIVAEDRTSPDLSVAVFRTANSRRALAALSARFYGEPSRRMCVIGITGTNGKTTVACLTESILAAAGFFPGVIGTINYRYCGRVFENPVTTPESADLQEILSRMEAEGVTHVVMEVSSHAIALDRVADCFFDVGVFTNISRDHLDFHGDMESYEACKQRFFIDVLATGPKKDKAWAVINTSNESGRRLAARLATVDSGPRTLRAGGAGDNDVGVRKAVHGLNGITGELILPSGCHAFHSRLTGAYNLENILCAATAGVCLNLDPEAIVRGIETMGQVPGRLERVDCVTGKRHVFVDYAHTPTALENVIHAVRAATRGRMVCVFGCGGDRDRTKRPLMGAIAAERCDLVVVTSDNPRTEAPQSIINDILEGIRPTGARRYEAFEIRDGFGEKGYLIEPDRRTAIERAIRAAGPDDAVLIAGKGHETYQITGAVKTDFDDRVEAARVLHALAD